jgi:hypothetical protein
MKGNVEILINRAIYYLRREGEIVNSTGLGLYRVNGSVVSAHDVIDFADELRIADGKISLADSLGDGQ